MTLLAIVLLIVLGIAGLAMIPLGLPGLWVMLGGILAYGWLTGFRTVGVATTPGTEPADALASLGHVTQSKSETYSRVGVIRLSRAKALSAPAVGDFPDRH